MKRAMLAAGVAAICLAGCDCIGLGCPDAPTAPGTYIDIDINHDVNQQPDAGDTSGGTGAALNFRCQLANCSDAAHCSAITCSWDDKELHDLVLTAGGARFTTHCASPCVFDAEVDNGPRDVEATLENAGTVIAGPLGPFHTTS
ncbi:MAG TPA: hypothetical protein VMW48_11935 [Vicinamibacterales bacterium]|nr:hypothetical protein [Vicinamibacterales bacterium]